MDHPPGSLVLLHGFASSFAHGWQESGWVDILADFGCTAPRIDLPGHGSSMPKTDPSAYATAAEDVCGALPHPTDAVGFSAGAEILLRIAAAYPDCFHRLVLLGVGDNVFEASDPTPLAAALEGDAEPEDIQARLFYRMAVASGNDPTSLSAFSPTTERAAP